MLKMCLNWKVLVGLGAVAVGIYAVAPATMAAAFPILVLAACPLSMLLMMKAMHGDRNASAVGGPESSREDRLARLKAQQAALDAKIEALERGNKLRSSGRADGSQKDGRR
nr:DUF2933 domain-containing protein [Rubrobacter marinus]